MPDTDRQLTETARSLLRKAGEEALAKQVIVAWNPRMRSAAGRAWLLENRVDLNPALQGVNSSEIDRTLRHELAHLVAQGRAGKKRIPPHGAEWQRACAELGIPGEKATHHLPLPRRKQKKNFAYRCPRCGFIMERVRRVSRAVACAQCCKQFNGGKFSEDFLFELVGERKR